MCDTIVATSKATADGAILFGKNSDREPNEAHHVISIPASDHSPGSSVSCTYLDIPQVEHTCAILLAKPFWIWGAEMGSNEHGVTIGNEAVFTKEPYEKGPALTGMDLLRLALERASTASAALNVITGLMGKYSQGGNCGFRHRLFYHNSFLIADPDEAWVLETAGRNWAAKRVSGVYTISNGLTIGNDWDLASPELVDHAIEKGWCKNPGDFHFARCYSGFLYTRFSRCKERLARTTTLLDAGMGNLTASDFMSILRDHVYRDPDLPNLPDKGITGSTVCMHAGFGPIRGSQTTGSMVSLLHPDRATHFVTGTAAPCTGIFKPVWIDAGIPDTGPSPSGTYDATTLYWRHELLHRRVLRDYSILLGTYRSERDTLEKKFVSGALDRINDTVSERHSFSSRCFAEADKAEEVWSDRVTGTDVKGTNSIPYRIAWKGFNKTALMPDFM
ncbi:MAG: C69 family dipeptidase [Thermodesulfobacteriota bacterium]|nr:C69 family dipeptidase [Thermodesulfobacteriota bacterium]